MASIKNIIFDLGGVLLDIDYNKSAEAFRCLGFDHFKKMYNQFEADALFEQLETGKTTEENFFKVLMAASGSPITPEQITTAWNAMILQFRKESLSFLKSIADEYNLYLLSNTNSIHMRHFQQKLCDETGQSSLDTYFKKAWYSHRIGLRKPYGEIYEFVIGDAGLIPAETIFIDDTKNNLPMAAAAGIKAYLLKPGERIENGSFL